MSARIHLTSEPVLVYTDKLPKVPGDIRIFDELMLDGRSVSWLPYTREEFIEAYDEYLDDVAGFVDVMQYAEDIYGECDTFSGEELTDIPLPTREDRLIEAFEAACQCTERMFARLLGYISNCPVAGEEAGTDAA